MWFLVIFLSIPILIGILSFVFDSLLNKAPENRKQTLSKTGENRPNFRQAQTLDNSGKKRPVNIPKSKPTFRQVDHQTILKDQQISPFAKEATRQMLRIKNSDYCLAYDTNIFLKYPSLFSEYINTNKILIARQVYDELDKKKTDNEIGTIARRSQNMIEVAQNRGTVSILLDNKDDEDFRKFMRSKKLKVSSPDDQIIASYLKEKESNNQKILFISEDKGARIIARQVGLETIDYTS